MAEYIEDRIIHSHETLQIRFARQMYAIQDITLMFMHMAKRHEQGYLEYYLPKIHWEKVSQHDLFSEIRPVFALDKSVLLQTADSLNNRVGEAGRLSGDDLITALKKENDFLREQNTKLFAMMNGVVERKIK